jgi:ribose 5-phosphate isomerase A
MSPKQRAAEAALEFIESGMIVGIGTGSTAEFFIDALGAAWMAGKVRDIRGVPTSIASENRARQLGIPLITLADCSSIDVTVDGADEIDPALNLIKGLGGALLREKVVAQNSKKLIIIADSSKMVSKLGEKAALPVEVAKFGHEAQAKFLKGLGADPVLRMKEAQPMVTDNENLIYDCRFAQAIKDPAALDRAIASRAGIVESGLFLNIAAVALVADDRNVQRKTRS